MEIIAWNIMYGGGKRSKDIATVLRQRNPDVIVLGEYQSGTSDRLINELADAGWVHHAISKPPNRYGGVAVVSKNEVTTHPLPIPLLPFAYRFIAVELPTCGLQLRAVYAPLQKDPYVEFWNAMLDSLENESQQNVLMIGDLNAGLSHVDAPVDFFCSRYFNELPIRGYTDLWRHKHGPDAREHTWMGPVNPYRLDHAFGTAHLRERLIDCRYDHSVRESKLSDHSLLSVTLAPAA